MTSQHFSNHVIIPLQFSQPARMQDGMLMCHCGCPGCIVAAWTPYPVPRVMCLSQLMVQIHLGHSYLCLRSVMGTAPSVGPANPLVLGGGGKEKAGPDIPIQMFHIPVRSKWLQQPQRTKAQPFPLSNHFYFGASQLHHCFLCILLLYITALLHRHQFVFSRLLPSYNALSFFPGPFFCSFRICIFSTKTLYAKIQTYTYVSQFSLFPLQSLKLP